MSILILSSFSVLCADSDLAEDTHIAPIWSCDPIYVYYRAMEIENTVNCLVSEVKKSSASKRAKKRVIRLCGDILFELHGSNPECEDHY